MTFTFPLLPHALHTTENAVNLLIIEDPETLRRLLRTLREQINGQTGECVLGADNVPVEFSAAALLITDPLRLEVDHRRLAGKLLQEALQTCEDRYADIAAVMTEINRLASEICFAMPIEVDYTEMDDPAALLRMMNLHVEYEKLDPAEALLEHIKLQRRYFGKSFFILYGLKSLLTAEEMRAFYHMAFYEKLDLLMIEPYQREERIEEEIVTIIDRDLCVLS